MTDKRIAVAVGILFNKAGQFLVQQRREGADCAGKWEFPGGKLTAGERPKAALLRELNEELGIRLSASKPLTVLEHDYPHAKVRLHVYICNRWAGEPLGMEGQAILWAHPTAIAKLDLLAAAVPLLALAVNALQFPAQLQPKALRAEATKP